MDAPHVEISKRLRAVDSARDLDPWPFGCDPWSRIVSSGVSREQSLKPPTPEQLSLTIEISSAILAFVVVVVHLVREHFMNKPKTDPMTILARAAGLAILPQALIIMAATFHPAFLCTVQGLRVFFMLSGLSLFYVCLKSVTS
jgi:hypothetical protein